MARLLDDGAVRVWETDSAVGGTLGDGKTKDISLRPDISPSREIRLTQVGLGITLTATVLLLWQVGQGIAGAVAASRWLGLVGQMVFGLIAVVMIYGNVVYQLTRIGYFRRLQERAPAPRPELDGLFGGRAPSVTVLVPSYKEDLAVVRRTLLSAALQEYPGKRVVLLIDDPPRPKQAADRQSLDAVRGLPGRLQALLAGPAREFAAALEAFQERERNDLVYLPAEHLTLSEAHERAADWLEAQAKAHQGTTHSDQLFVELVLLQPAREHFLRARELELLMREPDRCLDQEAIAVDYRRLVARFQVTLTSFERKRYVNLSQEANKAMNLNSYISLLGQRWREGGEGERLRLEPCAATEDASLEVPASDYLITLDADSILSTDYAERLVHFAEQAANHRVAVVQTPYSAEPNPPALLERIAGATTDMQYIIHQGFTRFGATFWVGANALLRMTALRDICVVQEERGYPVRLYIQDRTVIEDTESSIDLVARGWQLHNYPERLSYSATPADFGSLLIQRRRWANGGLIILPKLLRYATRQLGRLRRGPEVFLRTHYLASTAAVNFGLPLLLLCPFEQNLRSVWFPLTCVPYYLLYGRDLVQAGYQVADLFRVYALNLMLIPINLGGVVMSIRQAWTREKIPFKRTPKVAGRTTAPAGYVLLEWGMVIYCGIALLADSLAGRWMHAGFDLLNGLFVAYAVTAFLGIRESREDAAALMPNLPTVEDLGVRWFGRSRPSALPQPRLEARLPGEGLLPVGASVVAGEPTERLRDG